MSTENLELFIKDFLDKPQYFNFYSMAMEPVQRTENCYDVFQYESFELNLSSNMKSKKESMIIQRLPTWFSMGLNYSRSLIFFCVSVVCI